MRENAVGARHGLLREAMSGNREEIHMPQKEPSLEDRLAHFIQSRVGPLPRDAAHILAKEFMLCSVPVLQEYVTTTYEENVFIGGNNGRT